ncbi:28S ribosomal protein S23, mitochondrial isoform X1 [Rhipicephalus sanguineus]|uniref:28S ribosomal protein S23, mitochondrial isoform X1 n=1 Tax=Rhipicephalus sanguineus TaxID=34632 RepID=UPI001895565E|nr:28S ribosomal protein S23, mitochondrial isoform X1 [Rhipicephalus sanguineus]
MAGSRIYKLGSIFTRVEGLLKAGGMMPSEEPRWLDVYRALPPIEEPSFYRTARGDVRPVFYPEDVARMQFYQQHPNATVDLQDTRSVPPCRRFLKEQPPLGQHALGRLRSSP